ncbi:MAG TPA: hypothetical protein DIW37_07795 [Chryseobacterium sp.]|nr:hypothetical protein [Chryseobacterium sp.]
MMIVLKIILCSGILLGLYYLLLEKEKTFTFNRFYLLFALVFSYTIPFLKIETKVTKVEENTSVFQEVSQYPVAEISAPIQETFDYEQLIIMIYTVISVLFLLKFIFSIIRLKKLKGEKIIYKNRTVVLLEKDVAPFSFLNTIYFSKHYIQENKVEENIFLHEEVHILQKHSLDVFLVEILKAVMWINPFIFLYKKAIVTNHEFIADEKVIHKKNNIKAYQELILSEILRQQSPKLTHQFSFNNTKKRFIMMTNKNSKFAQIKKYLCIPAFASLSFLFTEKVYANETIDASEKSSSAILDTPTTKSNNNEAYEEIVKIIKKYDDIIESKDYERFMKDVSRNEQIKLAELFKQLSSEEYQKLPLYVSYQEINRQIPTQKQLNQFLNSKYNIELDGKVINNNILHTYKPSDFYSVYILKVIPTNPDYGKYEYGVVLKTKDFAKKFNQQKNILVSFKIKNDEDFEMMKKNTDRVKKEVIYDTIRPKEGKNTTLKQETSKSTTNETVTTTTKDEATQLPQYPGGMNELRNNISKSFDGSNVKASKEPYRTEINYTVLEDGNIADVKATGNNEAFNTEAVNSFKKANENITWKPAEKDGKQVRYRMRIPLTMSFQN